MAVVPLVSLKVGESGKLVEIRAGRNLNHRLTELGFDRGGEIRVIRHGPPGPLLVELKGCCRMMLGWGEASKIMVEISD